MKEQFMRIKDELLPYTRQIYEATTNENVSKYIKDSKTDLDSLLDKFKADIGEVAATFKKDREPEEQPPNEFTMMTV